MYWTLTSFVSIVQAKALRVEKARKFFGIPKREEMVPKESPKKKKFPKSIKGFRESVRESKRGNLISFVRWFGYIIISMKVWITSRR